MISRNLRHLRVLLDVAERGSVTGAATACQLSQPAVTQAVGKLERLAGGSLFDRTREWVFLTDRGRVLAARVTRALALLDPALDAVSSRMRLTTTTAQLRALIAVSDAQNFTLATHSLGLAQPTVHRAIAQLEQEAGRKLFERTRFGLVASRACRALARAARRSFAELDLADSELAELDGREVGRIVIGALPLSRSVILPRALIEFRRQRPRQTVTIIDGTYDDLMVGLRCGDVDLIVGALREALTVEDVKQEWLFDDRLVVIAGNHHPLSGRKGLRFQGLLGFMWVVPRPGTPSRAQFSRAQFDAVFSELGIPPPKSLLETGSILLMREILRRSDHLGCISAQQAKAEIATGLLRPLDIAASWPGRPIGMSFRSDWKPTKAQALLLDLIREGAAATSAP